MKGMAKPRGTGSYSTVNTVGPLTTAPNETIPTTTKAGRKGTPAADTIRFAPALDPWTRCLECNGVLESVPVEQVAHLLQPGTLRTYSQFSRCPGCGRAYWRGAHARRLAKVVERATAWPEP